MINDDYISSIQSNEAAKAIVGLRSKLLDLSNRNQLLNFKHSPRSRNHLRIVNESMAHVIDDLFDGKYFDFIPLPEPDDIYQNPKDEDTDQFLIELENAKISDAVYQSMLKTLDETYNEHKDEAAYESNYERIERELRNKVRLSIGLKPYKGRELESVVNWARKNGINTSFELAELRENQITSDQKDRYLQTLHFKDELDHKLSGIEETAKLALNEKGVNSLYLAFGFLEWMESDTSDKALLSPLVLIPIEIEKTTINGEIFYRIKAIEDEVQSNITLIARLKQDFNISIPEKSAEETLDEYVKSVASLITRFPRWSIRRYMTLGHFAFARLVMYNDLDDKNWPKDRKLNDNNLIRKMFGGSVERDGISFAEIYNPDEESPNTKTPELVVDADSSQFSAVVDVVTGKNLVIQGPPGTGKSQTITNIIGAALQENKTVLFVAEKMAALEVVMSRLKQVGLGDYCLELHSTKAKKTQIIESLKKRLTVRTSSPNLAKNETVYAEIKESRDLINEYVQLMKTPFGVSGHLISEILWRSHYISEREDKHTESLPYVIYKVIIEDSDTWTLQKESKVKSLLAELRGLEATLLYPPIEHPWSWIQDSNITNLEHQIVIDKTQHALDCITALYDAVAKTTASIEIGEANTLLDYKKKLTAVLELNTFEKNDSFAELFKYLSSDINLISLHLYTTKLNSFWQLCEEINLEHNGTSESNAKNDGQLISVILKERLDSSKLIEKSEISKVLLSYKQFNAKIESLESIIFSTYDFKKELLEEVLLRISELEKYLPYLAGSDVSTRVVLFEKINLYATNVDRLEVFSNWINQVLITLGIGITKDYQPKMLQLIRLNRFLSEIDHEVLKDRSEDRLSFKGSEIFNILKHNYNKYLVFLKTLESYSFKSDDLNKSILLHRRSLISNSGIFSVFSSDYRAARRFVKRLYGDKQLPEKAEILSLLDNLIKLSELKEVASNNTEAEFIFGDMFSGIDTNFSRIESVVKLGKELEMVCSDSDGISIKFKKFIIHESQDKIISLKELLDGTNATSLNAIYQSQPEYFDNLSMSISELKTQLSTLNRVSELTAIIGINNDNNFSNILTLKESIFELNDLKEQLKQINSTIDHYKSIFVNDQILATSHQVSRYRELITKCNLSTPHKKKLLGYDGVKYLNTIVDWAVQCEPLVKSISDSFNVLNEYTKNASSFEVMPISKVQIQYRLALQVVEDLPNWCTWLKILDELRQDNVNYVKTALENGSTAADLNKYHDNIYYRSLAHRAHLKHPVLRKYSGTSLAHAQKRFQNLDHKLKELSQEKIKANICAKRPPFGQGVGSVKTFTEMALVQNEVSKSRRHVPMRDLLSRAGVSIQTLMPCFMMSPMSVAQFLKPNGIQFDLVIFDEASQVLPEDAIGAICRAKQVVVVGDQMQLPPTDFFKRAESGDADAADNEDTATIEGLESILDKALSTFQPVRRLLWHYRSRDPRLIAFSNKEFYNKELQLFPAPHDNHSYLGIQIVEVNGCYNARTNVEEAKAVVRATLTYMATHPDRSLGIVALNSTQKDLILSEMNRAISTNKSAGEYCVKWNNSLEPFFVKNLENVQGDERDTIFISTVFGKDSAGNFYQRFGPLNSSAGHRRLNVLFTRAKETVVIFTSIGSDDISVEDSSSWGRRALRDYLQYARTGMLEAGDTTDREADSDFELIVKNRLEIAGYQVKCQVGVTGYFIDLAVRSPSNPNQFILGVECDGAMYHSFKSARDRDRLRQEILEKLGWKIHRIWSTDWFQNPEKEMDKLIKVIESILQNKKAIKT